jgi:hypothetical protein
VIVDVKKPPGIESARRTALARTIREKVAKEVQGERDYQDAKWGGPEGDDKRTPAMFAGWITEYLTGSTERAARHDIRTRLRKVSALAAAAVEAIDRRAYYEGQGK